MGLRQRWDTFDHEEVARHKTDPRLLSSDGQHQYMDDGVGPGWAPHNFRRIKLNLRRIHDDVCQLPLTEMYRAEFGALLISVGHWINHNVDPGTQQAVWFQVAREQLRSLRCFPNLFERGNFLAGVLQWKATPHRRFVTF